jgi:hypothetical protein
MGNFSSAWALAAQAGTLAVLIAGCEAADDKQDAMVAEDAGLPTCSEPPSANFGACAWFELLSYERWPPNFSGEVTAIAPGSSACGGHLGGGPPDDSDGRGYALTISNGDFTATVHVYLPWSTPPVSVGDTVELDYVVQGGGIETPPSGSLTLRDDNDELLLWILNASFGFDEFERPRELTVQNGARTCMSGSDCPNVRRDLIAESGDSGPVAIEVGEMADVGDYVVLHGENTAGMCDFATDPYFHSVKLAAVRGSKASLDARDAAE